MSAQSQLEAYLREFRERLKRLIVARGAAVLAVAALAISLVAVYFGIRQAFAPGLIITARILLLVVIAGCAAGLIYWPITVLRRSRGVAEIERRGAGSQPGNLPRRPRPSSTSQTLPPALPGAASASSCSACRFMA